ncbi:MAG: phosphate ABC transporter substrate-binding protein PstS [Acidimicrobiales bacterium]
MFTRVTPEVADAASGRAGKKRWVVVTLVLAGGLVAAACGSSTPEKHATNTTTTEKKSNNSTTTSTTAAPAAVTTTTAKAAAVTTTTAKAAVVTPTTAKPVTTTTAAAGANNALGGANDFVTPAASLTGAGSTFDQPLFARQFYDYNHANSKVTVNYASVGSGTGESDILSGSVNFGASDVPEPAGTTGSGGAILQIPVVLGGIAMAYNEPCLGAHTQLTGTQIAQIFAGKITDWNKIDGSCAAGSNIVPVHRADSSGTTNAFTHYMTAVDSTDWPAANDGKTSSGWVGGLGGNGNAGVAGDVADTPGAIGYVELAYALQSGLNYAAVQNAAGQYVVPNEGSVATDAAAFPNVSPTNYLIVNGSGAGAYPISTYSWVIVYQKQSNTNNGIALGKMLHWMATTGQSDAAAIGYVPLPANIQALATSTIMQMENSGGQPLFS